MTNHHNGYGCVRVCMNSHGLGHVLAVCDLPAGAVGPARREAVVVAAPVGIGDGASTRLNCIVRSGDLSPAASTTAFTKSTLVGGEEAAHTANTTVRGALTV